MKKLAYMAVMAVLICICSWIMIPFTVPFTMQTFAVFSALLILGGRQGTGAIAIYLLLGAVGLPVFSGFKGGVWQLAGPTGGFLTGFLLCGCVYMLCEPAIEKNKKMRWTALAAGLLLCYATGTLWFMYTVGGDLKSVGLVYALSVCVLPFVVPDFIKMILAVYVSDRVKQAIGKSSHG